MDDAKKLIIDFFISYGLQIIGALIIMGLGGLLAKYLGRILDEALTKKGMEPPLRNLICRGVKILIFAFTAVLALEKFGVPIAPMVAGIGVAGVGIGLAMQGVLGNVVSGLTIIFTKPFRLGEWVEMLGVRGEVTAIELFSTTLTHPDRSRIIIPNRKIVGEILHNYGAVRQLTISVGVAYATDLKAALAAARRVVDANPRLLKEPTAAIGISSLGDSAINIVIQPWVSVSNYGPAGAELNLAVVEEFRRSNISIPFPQREIRILKEPEPPVELATTAHGR
ncbi:MAG: MscS Mechanosensitive ion channel [Verrucomicrobia bacterium]|jgi:small conductance mechanosensitive channel|nr:MscS Mechanosensitive ion channel [Verrucomicrobiota bacterium]